MLQAAAPVRNVLGMACAACRPVYKVSYVGWSGLLIDFRGLAQVAVHLMSVCVVCGFVGVWVCGFVASGKSLTTTHHLRRLWQDFPQ